MPSIEPAAPEIVLSDKRTTWTRQTLERAITMWKAGISARIIGDTLHMTRCAVMGKVQRMGLRRRDRAPHSPSHSKVSAKSNSAGFAAQRQARRTAVAVQAPAAAEPPMPFLGLALVELERQHCRYPRGDEVFTFCGQPRLDRSPYCPHHHRLCFAKGPVR